MDITPVIPSTKKVITGYGSGVFKVNNEPYSGNIIIYPDAVTNWQPSDDWLSIESLSSILENDKIELLIIGCGKEHRMLPIKIIKAFREKHISVEIMATGAACRTYNVLLGEGRQVAAALVAF